MGLKETANPQLETSLRTPKARDRQANTNLAMTNWLNLGSAPANGAGLFQFIDTTAPQHPRRFYRAVKP